MFLTLRLDRALAAAPSILVESDMLGHTFESEATFEDYDATPLRLDRDFQEKPQSGHIGPFADLVEGEQRVLIWSSTGENRD